MSEKIMMERIKKANDFMSANKANVAKSAYRQRWHLAAPTGWINDPNGLCYFNGKYHFFYQLNPYYGFWDYIHWGHGVSPDMVHWTDLGAAMAPSEVYDDHYRGGCFSGSSLVHDGKLYVMYTGCTNFGNGFEQTQCVAFGDAKDDARVLHKYEGNPVLTAPEGADKAMFRDPKVWEHDGSFYMVCGVSRGGRAQALLYKSADFLNWQSVSVLAESRGELGFMWECPDFFEIDGKYVLMLSPMGCGERTSVYLLGDFDYRTGRFDYHTMGAIDWGHDYYAPQSFLAPDGRRIIAGWANSWDWMPFWKDWGPAYRDGWCGAFACPREVTLADDGALRFLPIRELESLRTDGHSEAAFTVKDGEEKRIQAGDGISYEIKAVLDIEKTTAGKVEFLLRRGKGDDGKERQAVCYIDLVKSTIGINRDNADGWSRGESKSTLLMAGKKTLEVRFFVDVSSIEMFCDGGANNHSMNVFAAGEQNGAAIKAIGGEAVIKSLECWAL